MRIFSYNNITKGLWKRPNKLRISSKFCDIKGFILLKFCLRAFFYMPPSHMLLYYMNSSIEKMSVYTQGKLFMTSMKTNHSISYLYLSHFTSYNPENLRVSVKMSSLFQNVILFSQLFHGLSLDWVL